MKAILKENRSVLIITFGVLFACILIGGYQLWNAINATPPVALTWEKDNYLWLSRSGKAIRWDVDQHVVTYNGFHGDEHFLVTKTGQVWAFGGGAKFLTSSGKWFETTLDGIVYDMIQTSDGAIWIATANGYYFWNEQINEWELSSIQSSGRTLIEGRDSTLWFGLTEKGLLQLRGEKPIHWTSNDALIDNEVYSLLVAGDDSVWVGTRWGVHRWNSDKWQKWDDLGTLDADGPIIDQIFETESGVIWVSVATEMARWDGQNWDVFETPEYGFTNSFLETVEGTLWAARTNGLYRWDELAWYEYGETEGIADNRFSHLVEGSNGILYAATNSGLYQYDSVQDYWHPFPEPGS